MTTLIQQLCPTLASYPFFMAIAEMCFAFFFGGFIFSSFWNLVLMLVGGGKQ